MQRYKLLFVLAIAAVFFGSGAAFGASPKIGVINVGYVVSNSNRGQAATAALKALYKKKKSSLDENKKSLQARQEKLKAAQNKKSDSFKKQVAQFRQSAGQFQQRLKQSQNEVQKRRSELFKPILKDLHKVINQYAKAHDYTLILNATTDAVAFAADSYNLNDQMVKALDDYEGE